MSDGDDSKLFESFGEYAWGNVRGSVHRMRMVFDEPNRTAHLELCLDSQDWATRTAVIEKLLDVREVFMDEVSFDFEFRHAEKPTQAVKVDESILEYA